MYLVDLGKDRTSDISENYLIANGKDSCDCLDWPRVHLCKHIAAIVHFSPEAATPEAATPEARVPIPEVQWESSSHDKSLASSESAAPILENLISKSRDFLSNGPSSPGTVRSLRMVELHLLAVIQNSQASQSSLPDRESLPPNQRTWTETTKQMGAKRRKRPHPTNTSPTAGATN
jgi:hypothetical protein